MAKRVRVKKTDPPRVKSVDPTTSEGKEAMKAYQDSLVWRKNSERAVEDFKNLMNKHGVDLDKIPDFDSFFDSDGSEKDLEIDVGSSKLTKGELYDFEKKFFRDIGQAQDKTGWSSDQFYLWDSLALPSSDPYRTKYTIIPKLFPAPKVKVEAESRPYEKKVVVKRKKLGLDDKPKDIARRIEPTILDIKHNASGTQATITMSDGKKMKMTKDEFTNFYKSNKDKVQDYRLGKTKASRNKK